MLIVMAVDSAVTLAFESNSEYTTGRKAYFFPGVGCVTTWGARDNNNIGNYLERKSISSKKYTIEDLSNIVYEYLINEYRPQKLGFDDVGFHVGGFDKHSRARLFHIFWGFDRPKPPDQIEQKYAIHDHSPQKEKIQFLFNGRNDLATIVINTLLNELKKGGNSHYSLNTLNNIVCFSDFVLRFGTEITPEVGLPFITHLISKTNKSEIVKNHNLSPINPDEISEALNKLCLSE